MRTQKEVDDEYKLIEHMLSEVEASLKKPNDFIESLRYQFDERGTLSEKQRAALGKFYDRID